MRTIHKYVLDEGRNELLTYECARFIHVDNQQERVTVWAEVRTMARECMRTLHIVGTGGEVPADADYVGSALVSGGAFVFHVYADREPA